VDRLLEVGKFAEAVDPAREAAQLAAEAYGPRDWRTFDPGRRLKVAQTGKDLPADKRKRLAEAIQDEAHAQALEGSMPAEAERLALRAAEGFAAVLGEQTPEHARTWHLVGWLRFAGNDARGAKEAHLKALGIFRKSFPDGHPAIAGSLTGLGLVQQDLGEYEAARKSYEEALAIIRKALPKGHPHIAMGLTNLGVVQQDLGDYEGARKSHQEALDIFHETRPEGHPDIAQSLSNLGVVQRALGDQEAARKSHQEALDIRRQALPKGHPDISLI
jgi:tetratricopeptide (TPR) repeat protein